MTTPILLLPMIERMVPIIQKGLKEKVFTDYFPLADDWRSLPDFVTWLAPIPENSTNKV